MLTQLRHFCCQCLLLTCATTYLDKPRLSNEDPEGLLLADPRCFFRNPLASVYGSELNRVFLDACRNPRLGSGTVAWVLYLE
jgi:hypothetical protein